MTEVMALIEQWQKRYNHIRSRSSETYVMKINNTSPIYQEIQHFRQLWVWVLMLFISVLCIYGAIQQLIMGKPFGNNPASDSMLIVITIIFGFGFPVFMYKIHLTTEVHEDGLYFRYFPLHLSFRKINLEDIAGFNVETYRAIIDYGGWGIKYGRKGQAYNVSGNRGVQLQLSDGKRILIGSQRAEELAEALKSALRK